MNPSDGGEDNKKGAGMFFLPRIGLDRFLIAADIIILCRKSSKQQSLYSSG